MGGETFDAMMDAFGREHAGKAVSAAQFQTHVEKWVGNSRANFFDPWVTRKGLPRYQLAVTGTTSTPKGHEVTVEIRSDRAGPPSALDVTLETAKGEVTRQVRLDGTTARAVLETSEPPLHVVLDKYGQAARANGGPFSILTYYAELERTLIVYGTADEQPTNREAAEALRQALRERGANITVPVRADSRVSDDDLKSHHVLLIGRPGTNTVVNRFHKELPISFGSGSFAVRDEVYSHPDSAVIAACENPLNKRFSLVVIAGLGAASTLHAAPLAVARYVPNAEVVILPHAEAARSLVLPAKDLICEVKETVSRKEGN
jgi:hypothetical protein